MACHRKPFLRRGCRGRATPCDHSPILFRPTGFEQGLGREGWESLFADVIKVDLAKRELNFLSGGLRRRLLIRTKVSTELFVVWRPKSVADRLARTMTHH